ncbi:MAG: magnesium chelatase ATPase subunit I [Chlorobi bacterium CHB2]|nr:magnesium chelatase ATPase subunit I [Chlorobi bacterium CHB2]
MSIPSPYPFAAIVGQEQMKLALLLVTVDTAIGGVLIMGHRGSGKSTSVRALAGMLPAIKAVLDCPYHCAATATATLCERCTDPQRTHLVTTQIEVPVVDLPLGATEDRVTGTLDLEHALSHGKKRFEPGLLARANRGYLYIDEVNLLEDHLVDLLLDVAASGWNVVEREGVSVRHPARFALIGSGNPEEGELRPQLLDRFGLHAVATTPTDPRHRAEVIRRRLDFDDNPIAFARQWEGETEKLRKRIAAAQKSFPNVKLSDQMLEAIAAIAARLELDGHRGELVMARAARANAALESRRSVTADDIRHVAPLAIGHRLRKNPLETVEVGRKIEEAVEAVLRKME